MTTDAAGSLQQMVVSSYKQMTPIEVFLLWYVFSQIFFVFPPNQEMVALFLYKIII